MLQEYACYNTIPKLISHRSQERIIEFPKYKHMIMIKDKLLSHEFSKLIRQHGYILFSGSKEDTLYLYMLVYSGSNLAKQSTIFKEIKAQIMNDVSDWMSNTDYTKLKIMYIFPHDFSAHFTKAANINEHEDIEYSWEVHQYHIFLQSIPDNVLVPKHEICDPKEVELYCNFQRIEKENFPKILIDDPMCVWIGAELGDVIKIHRVSENTGISIAYRYVVENFDKVKLKKSKRKDINL